MANCGSGNQVLDPFQSIINAVDKTVGTLEKQANSILPFVQDFRDQGSSFSPEDISPETTVDLALNDYTAEAICAGQTDLEPINDFIEDCLNDALRSVKKFLADILENIENGIDFIDSILDLPESILMQLLQKVWRLCDNISGLVGGIDGKIDCITSLDVTGTYQDEINALNSRVNQVTDELYLDADGSFNSTNLMTGFDSALQTNLDSYYNRSIALQSEIEDNIENTIQLGSTVNPSNKF